MGDHIRRRRLDLGLLQREVAKKFSVCESVVWRWETGKTEPELRSLPRIFEFIGGDPRPKPTSLGAKLIRWREHKGWSRKRLAAK
ncbi:MAG: helix-turn-helix domain-containing protein, partial [Acidobacteriota bacterium]